MCLIRFYTKLEGLPGEGVALTGTFDKEDAVVEDDSIIDYRLSIVDLVNALFAA